VARERGQATVELLGVVPVLLVLGLVVWQLILVGHAAWMSAHAARAAARADLVGQDPKAAARSVLRGADVDARGGAIRVGAPVPILHRSWRAPLTITARTSLEAVR
jgi:pilus assembly protein CpaE